MIFAMFPPIFDQDSTIKGPRSLACNQGRYFVQAGLYSTAYDRAGLQDCTARQISRIRRSNCVRWIWQVSYGSSIDGFPWHGTRHNRHNYKDLRDAAL